MGEVAADDLLSSDAVIVGSPVYFGNMSGEVKTFFDNWNLKFRLSQERRISGIDDNELADARDLGKRVAEVASVIKRGTK